MPTPSISSPLGLKGTTQALWEDSPDLPDCLSLSSNISLCPNIHQNWLGATRFRAPGTGPGAQETIHYCVSMNEWVREWLSEWVNKWVKGEEWKPLRTHSHRNSRYIELNSPHVSSNVLIPASEWAYLNRCPCWGLANSQKQPKRHSISISSWTRVLTHFASRPMKVSFNSTNIPTKVPFNRWGSHREVKWPTQRGVSGTQSWLQSSDSFYSTTLPSKSSSTP